MTNDRLTDLTKDGLEDLFFTVNNYDVEYQPILKDISNDLTYGLEIEYEGASFCAVKERMADFPGWTLVKDFSVMTNLTDEQEMEGGEITSPILSAKNQKWDALANVCEMLDQNGAVINEKAAAHIHIGAQVLGDNVNDWIRFIKLWVIYEKVIYRFGYGEQITNRYGADFFARPLTKGRFNSYEEFKECMKGIPSIMYLTHKLANLDRYQGINFANFQTGSRIEEGNTVEIRCPNGTINPIVWQNNVHFFSRLMMIAKQKNISKEWLEDKLDHVSFGDNMSLYDQIYVDDALELCDLIYDNNKDKLCFLKQYLKNFECAKELQGKKIKLFTKKK